MSLLQRKLHKEKLTHGYSNWATTYLLAGFSLVTSSRQLALYGSENFYLLNTDKF